MVVFDNAIRLVGEPGLAVKNSKIVIIYKKKYILISFCNYIATFNALHNKKYSFHAGFGILLSRFLINFVKNSEISLPLAKILLI